MEGNCRKRESPALPATPTHAKANFDRLFVGRRLFRAFPPVNQRSSKSYEFRLERQLATGFACNLMLNPVTIPVDP
jgi:hypothetical protein